MCYTLLEVVYEDLQHQYSCCCKGKLFVMLENGVTLIVAHEELKDRHKFTITNNVNDKVNCIDCRIYNGFSNIVPLYDCIRKLANLMG